MGYVNKYKPNPGKREGQNKMAYGKKKMNYGGNRVNLTGAKTNKGAANSSPKGGGKKTYGSSGMKGKKY